MAFPGTVIDDWSLCQSKWKYFTLCMPSSKLWFQLLFLNVRHRRSLFSEFNFELRFWTQTQRQEPLRFSGPVPKPFPAAAGSTTERNFWIYLSFTYIGRSYFMTWMSRYRASSSRQSIFMDIVATQEPLRFCKRTRSSKPSPVTAPP